MEPGDDGVLSIQRQVQISVEEHGDLDPAVLALTLTLYRTTAMLDRLNAAELAPHGLTLSQFNVLTVLHRAGHPLTMSALGQAVAVRLGNLTGIVDTLIKRGLVRRQRNPQDRRSLLITITPAGGEFLSGFLPGHWSYLQRLFSGLNAVERDELVQALKHLSESMSAAGPPPSRAQDPSPMTP